jgi:hypothetical protein
LATVHVNDAIFLSLGIVQGDNTIDSNADAFARGMIADTHIAQGTLPVYHGPTDQHRDRRPVHVKLTEFRAWGESLPAPFTFPDEFPKVANAEPTAPVATKTTQDKPMATKERNSLLRIIRALDVMAELPDRGPASCIVLQLQQLGFSGPSDDTIRKVIIDARALEKD